jgi:hypothetical protein
MLLDGGDAARASHTLDPDETLLDVDLGPMLAF